MSIEAMKQAAQQALNALDEATTYTGSPSWSPSMTDECIAAASALRAALAQQPDNASCKSALRAALSQQPATAEPVLFIHPDTFAMNSAHVGAWKPGHELTSYIPLYTRPAPSVPDDDFDLICNAIDKADTITMEGDYMLDSDDCIAVVRVMQVLLSVRAAMLAAK